MSGFYVEVMQPDGIKLELSAHYDSFDDAFGWLEQRMSEDPKRIPRIRGDLTPEEQARFVAVFGPVEPI